MIKAAERLSIAVAIASAIFAFLHVPLIFGGQWAGDEWAQFFRLHEYGWGWFWLRLIEWSPRPLSESTLAGYYFLQSTFRAPMIEVFLGLLWAFLAGCIFIAAPSRRDHPDARALTLFVIASLFLGHGIFNAFLWPMSAAAYVLALAGVVGFFLLGLFGGEPETAYPRILCGAFLVVAATAAECGAFFVISIGALLALRGPRPIARNAWYFVPFAIAVGIVVLGLTFRVSHTPAGAGGPYLLNIWTSFAGAIRDLPLRLLSLDDASVDLDPATAILVRILLFGGALLVFQANPLLAASRDFRTRVTLALVGTIFLISLSSYYAYGVPGGSAHETFQQCLSVFAVIGAASVVPPILEERWRGVGLAALIMALAIGVATRLPELRVDYALIGDIRQSIAASWASGQAPGTTGMTFVAAPAGRLLASVPPPIGNFSLSSPGVRWDVDAIMRFFGKSTIDVVQFDRPAKAPR
jgi:hypothetical protein